MFETQQNSPKNVKNLFLKFLKFTSKLNVKKIIKNLASKNCLKKKSTKFYPKYFLFNAGKIASS